MAKTIEEIYNDYKIMPSLREHMYRTAAVASILCDHFNGIIDRKSILQTCLLHDMGNIVKFEFDKFPEFTKPEGREYWEAIRADYLSKYQSDNAREITLKIAEEVGASLRTLELLNSSTGFDRALKVLESNEFEKKICLYSDMRAAPLTVTSLSERLDDLLKRYSSNPNTPYSHDRDDRVTAVYKIEKEIFKNVDVTEVFVDEKNVQNIIPHLKSIQI